MDILKLMKSRRSIRKYQERQVSVDNLAKILEAGTWASNAGGWQRSKIVCVRNTKLVGQIGRLNVANMNRKGFLGTYVSVDQPSIVDDIGIRSGFYGAPSLAIIFAPHNFGYGMPDAYCCAQNMVLEAYNLGIGSCIVARGEETFNNTFGENLLRKWDIPKNYTARCFVSLGYCTGAYPKQKPRNSGRIMIVE